MTVRRSGRRWAAAAGIAALAAVLAGACGGASSSRTDRATATSTSTGPGSDGADTSTVGPAPSSTAPAKATTTVAGPGALPPGPGGPPGPVGWTVGPWQAAGRPVNGTAAVEVTTLQSDSGHLAIAAARLDTRRLRFVLYAGSGEPSGTWTAQRAVDSSLWPTLVATFNSGFKLNSSRGGYYADGRAAAPLRNGAASLVIYQDGSTTVGQWGRDAQLAANVSAVRQNLELLVDGGRAAANVSGGQQIWGFTLNNVVANWRSAVGVDASGRLLYVGGNGLDPPALANALIAVGAVRAMELDINPQWVSFDTFADGPGGVVGTKLLAGMNEAANHYLVGANRDFVAVFAR